MISDKKDYEKLADRADGRHLFLCSGEFYIDSTHELDKVNLTDEAYDKLERHGEIRQLFVSKTGISQFFLDETSTEVDFFMQFMQPKIIELWKKDQLAWCET